MLALVAMILIAAIDEPLLGRLRMPRAFQTEGTAPSKSAENRSKLHARILCMLRPSQKRPVKSLNSRHLISRS